MAQTKPKAGQFYGVSNNGTDGEFLQTDGTGGMAWASPITNPTITSIDYPGSATAANPAGGESVIINGTLFASGIICTVGGTSAVTAFNSATQITITTPVKAAGPYTVAVLNPDGGTASQASFIQYSGVPVWSTAAGTLGNVIEGGAASFQVTATEGSDTIEYAVTTGTLPTGLSLATATGAITGTAPTVSADTTTTFSITATDDENQTSASRSFSITVQNDAPSNHFNTITYTGNSSTQAITGLGFEPDLVWIKNRNGVPYSQNGHSLFDSIRGTTHPLSSNTASAQGSTTDYFTSFDSNGFTLPSNSGTQTNASGGTYAAWNFKAGGAAVTNTDGTISSQVSANNTLGFSISTWNKTTNASTASTFGHGLDAAPEMIIIKRTNGAEDWYVYEASMGAGARISLNSTAAKVTGTSVWDNTVPTSTLFTVKGVNAGEHVAYCFTSKPGFSKVGSYTGNGSASGPIVQTGFEPAFLLVKRTNSVASWRILDNKRFSGSNKSSLIPNSSAAEQVGYIDVSFYANGFSINSNNADFNASGGNYIYLAIAADGSTATPSLANSFATELYTGNGGTQSVTTGFKPDFTWIKDRVGTDNHHLFDSIRGVEMRIISNLTDAQNLQTNSLTSFNTLGFSLGSNSGVNASGENHVSWNWKAGGTPAINTDGTITSVVSANQAAGFSVVSYIGASGTVGHGLGSAPEIIFIKVTNTADNWVVYNNTIGATKALFLDLTNAASANSTYFNNTNPSSSVFTLGTSFNNSNNYIAYCFTSISGYSKVGTYTGNGNINGPTETLGFEPGFLLIKDTSSVDAWVIYDSARNTSNPRSCHLRPNSSAVEYCGTPDSVNFNSNDFQVISTWDAINKLNDVYIYLAIKEN
jgi:hypothetical protein